jgi:hypothetical protein
MDQIFQRDFERRGLFQIVDIQGMQLIQGQFASFSQRGKRHISLSLFDEYENRICSERGQ